MISGFSFAASSAAAADDSDVFSWSGNAGASTNLQFSVDFFASLSFFSDRSTAVSFYSTGATYRLAI